MYNRLDHPSRSLLTLLAAGALTLTLAACGGDDGAPRDAGSGDTGVRDLGLDLSTFDAGPGCAETLCGAACVDTSSDPTHCGDCATRCAPGEACTEGDCTLACPAAQTACDGVCASTATDRLNCGDCGLACAAGEVCSASACAVECAADLATCAEVDGTAYCANTDVDRTNCGACGRTCSAVEFCIDGDCTSTCPSALRACGGACRDVETDRAHCGDCGIACAASEVCVAGECATSCATDQTACDGACTNTDFDPSHCGSCDVACAAPADGSAVCAEAGCDFVCDRNFVRVRGACVAATCVPSCATDADCQDSCPSNPTAGLAVCCDRGTGSCFNATTAMCPLVVEVDASVVMSM